MLTTPRACVLLALLSILLPTLTACNGQQDEEPPKEPSAALEPASPPTDVSAEGSPQASTGRRQFHHIALVTDKPQPGEIHYPSLKLWATSPDENPNRMEWIRFAPDSPLGKTPVGKMPHVAFLVDDMDKQLEGKEVVAGPVQVTEKLRVAYFMMDGLLVEYMEGEL